MMPLVIIFYCDEVINDRGRGAQASKHDWIYQD